MATQQPTEYEWNGAERLPPVGCPLVININGLAVKATRVSHLSDRSGQMDYRLVAGDVIRGRYQWSYP